MKTKIQIPGLDEMIGRVILAAIAIGAGIALAMGLRESGTAIAFLLTAGSVAASVLLSGTLDRVRPVSRPTTAFATIVEGLRQHWLARFLTSDRTAQWLCAAVVGLVVAMLDSGLQAWFWPGQEVTPWQQLLSLTILLLPGYVALGIILPRDRAAWTIQVEKGIREMLKLAPRTAEPSLIPRALGRAVARTSATVAARALSILLVTWLTSSWLLMLAAGLIALFLIAGGEVISQLRTIVASARGERTDTFSWTSADEQAVPIVLPEPPAEGTSER